ncbi:MAG: hypothetical protein COZ05_18070 [Armatimonadetes bacterium CG_4_10_14_3_um_filter_59_10]|nr:MAG: hypothetical protein COZ05_18070 [Armatimonadetes bacterium CG_4_10_14_3_um_filter_59_10]
MLLTVLLPILLSAAPLAAQDAGYKFVEPSESLPNNPWHDTFIDETAKTPEGQPNAGATWCDHFLQAAIDNRLRKTAAQMPWEKHPSFFSWTVWGYLSPDSKFKGDARLLEMSRTWLDTLFVDLATKPADAKAAEQWQPNRLNTWGFHDYTMPLLEAEKRPELKKSLGEERIHQLREIILANVRSNTTPEAFNDLMGRADKYINIITHPMAVYIHGWLLTGEKKYLQMAYQIVHTLGRDQLPNGMFPYRYKIHSNRHCEYEMMYYHAMNLRGLYMYWWATGSKEAADIFRKSIPYYPLNMEPPYFFNGGADIWWKDQWRTFWPHHIAMVAAVTGDGENARIANDMARNSVSHDRIDLVLGAHAYQQMGLRNVAAKPVRNNYLLEDPDIRGVRLRFGRWSSTFTAGSFTYTRASAMRVADDDKSFSTLHLARPFVRVAPLEKAYRTEPDYGTLGHSGADYSFARTGTLAAIGTSYSPALTAATWQENQPIAPWKMDELWLMTESGMVGLIVSTAMEDNEARELCHQFRFIIPSREDAKSSDGNRFACGDMSLRIWDTDLPFRIPERTRRYALGEKDRSDWQLCLSDADRSPEQVAQEAAKEQMATLKLPAVRKYEKGYKRFSLLEVSPAGDGDIRKVEALKAGNVLGFLVQRGDSATFVFYNPQEKTEAVRITTLSSKPKSVAASWEKIAPGALGKTPLPVPARGVLLVTY